MFKSVSIIIICLLFLSACSGLGKTRSSRVEARIIYANLNSNSFPDFDSSSLESGRPMIPFPSRKADLTLVFPRRALSLTSEHKSSISELLLSNSDLAVFANSPKDNGLRLRGLLDSYVDGKARLFRVGESMPICRSCIKVWVMR